LVDKKGQRGDLYAQLKVVMPTFSDEETKAIWQSLAEKAAFDPRVQWSK